MKDKIIIAMFGIGFLLVVSLVYAGVLNYYGKIVGNVNVQGPIFYAHSEGSDLSEKYELSQRIPDGSEKDFDNVFIGKTFVSPPLGVNGNFYSANWEVCWYVYVVGGSVKYYARLRVVDENGNEKTLLKVFVTDVINSTSPVYVCKIDKIDSFSLLPTDRLQLEIYASWESGNNTNPHLIVDNVNNPTKIRVVSPA